MTACDYPHPVKLEQGVGLHYKPFWLLWIISSFAIQTLGNPNTCASDIFLFSVESVKSG